MWGLKVALLAIVCVSIDAAATPEDCPKIDMAKSKKCCVQTVPENLASAKVLNKCSKDKQIQAWMNSYKMYQFQDPKADNVYDLSQKNLDIMCAPAKFINCVFSTYDIGKDGTFDGAAAFAQTTLASKKDGDYWKDTLKPLIEDEYTLFNYMSAMFNKTVDCKINKKTQTGVYLGYLFLVQYLQAFFPMGCTTVKFEGTNAKCEDIYKKYQTCYFAFQKNLYTANSFGQKSLDTFRVQGMKMFQKS